MNEHFAEEIQVEDIARVACLSKFHFIRLFKRTFGQTPYAYLLSIRLVKAREIIIREPIQIREIAWMVGFNQRRTFSRSFKRRYGHSPSEFQMMVRNPK